MSLKDRLANATRMMKNLLPSSYQIVGNIILIKLPNVKKLEQKKKIAQSLMTIFPYVKTVCEIVAIKGELREPRVRVLAGDGTETIHRESNILYRLDVSKIMFSKGNLFERQRLIKKIKEKETIIDMFAGIGYFSLGLAKFSTARRIISIEKNKIAYEYLKDNIKLNNIKKVKPIRGDCRRLAKDLKGKADRIIMGYLIDTEEYLPFALTMLKKKGIIHFHDIYREDELWQKPVEEISNLVECFGYHYKVLEKRKVKSYAPKVWHAVIDVEIRK